MDETNRTYIQRRNAQLLGFAVVVLGTVCVGVGERVDIHLSLVSLMSFGMAVTAAGVGVMVFFGRCPVCNRPVNYLLMRMERHDRCGRCWQKQQQAEPQPAAPPYSEPAARSPQR